MDCWRWGPGIGNIALVVPKLGTKEVSSVLERELGLPWWRIIQEPGPGREMLFGREASRPPLEMAFDSSGSN